MASRSNGPLTAYRIADRRFPILDPTGAGLIGGRWNSPARPVIYAALTFAGCLLEQLAHAQLGSLPKSQVWITIRIPRTVSIEEVEAGDVPGWNSADLVVGREYGDTWLEERRTAVLVVPSVVGQPIERNVLINPSHKDFARIKPSEPRPVEWDERLLGR